ncbi:hypothetical protein HYH02_011461 [Chlamydomonas schloesseri]|uniref:OTU domain-containing protein n=1 Tax=Chlamydomonas schloesseri TaxID=2026947 RepID=A0A835T0D7_9CHLO|nr:hypothetical protein HYH02_011461 [Chlamydomonas schloesseri]|eukprot:KAG2436523.1 hypothetical protein HYH02_011461 [Chlamydomonas schloesseri]
MTEEDWLQQLTARQDSEVVMAMVAALTPGPDTKRLLLPDYKLGGVSVVECVSAFRRAVKATVAGAMLTVQVVGSERLNQVGAQAELYLQGKHYEDVRNLVVPAWLGLRLADVPGAGDCMFEAVILWLTALGLDVKDIETGAKFRAATFKHCSRLLERAEAALVAAKGNAAVCAGDVAALATAVNGLKVVQEPLRHLQPIVGEGAAARHTVPETINVIHALLQKRYGARCPAILVVEASPSFGGMEVVMAGMPPLAEGTTSGQVQLDGGRCVMLVNNGGHYWAAVPTRGLNLMAADVDAVNTAQRGQVVPPWCVDGDEDGKIAAAASFASVRQAEQAAVDAAANAASQAAGAQRRAIDARLAGASGSHRGTGGGGAVQPGVAPATPQKVPLEWPPLSAGASPLPRAATGK